MEAETLRHTEIHKAYERVVNSQVGCLAPDIRITRKQRITSTVNESNIVRGGGYTVECDQPEKQLITAININGDTVRQNDITYWRDFYNKGLETDVSTWTGTSWIQWDKSGTKVHDIPAAGLLVPYGTYEITLHTFTNGCSGWKFSVNNGTATGEYNGEEGRSYTFRFVFRHPRLTTRYSVGNEGTDDECSLKLHAVELYRVKDE